jgi:hypothetical protein
VPPLNSTALRGRGEKGITFWSTNGNFSKSVGSHQKEQDKTESVCYAQVL